MLHEARYAPSPDVLFRKMDNEVILLDLKRGAYYGLDSVGAMAWAMLSDGRVIAEIETAIGDDFDVEPEIVRSDLAMLVQDLCAKRLLEPAGPKG
jgi:hypothetical protein